MTLQFILNDSLMFLSITKALKELQSDYVMLLEGLLVDLTAYNSAKQFR